jgi:hypothetical protein
MKDLVNVFDFQRLSLVSFANVPRVIVLGKLLRAEKEVFWPGKRGSTNAPSKNGRHTNTQARTARAAGMVLW